MLASKAGIPLEESTLNMQKNLRFIWTNQHCTSPHILCYPKLFHPKMTSSRKTQIPFANTVANFGRTYLKQKLVIERRSYSVFHCLQGEGRIFGGSFALFRIRTTRPNTCLTSCCLGDTVFSNKQRRFFAESQIPLRTPSQTFREVL